VEVAWHETTFQDRISQVYLKVPAAPRVPVLGARPLAAAVTPLDPLLVMVAGRQKWDRKLKKFQRLQVSSPGKNIDECDPGARPPPLPLAPAL
jgi:hypothetical protein